MPNRNWKDRKEYWKEYFLGNVLKVRAFGLDRLFWAFVEGDQMPAMIPFRPQKGYRLGVFGLPICRDCVLAPSKPPSFPLFPVFGRRRRCGSGADGMPKSRLEDSVFRGILLWRFFFSPKKKIQFFLAWIAGLVFSLFRNPKFLKKGLFLCVVFTPHIFCGTRLDWLPRLPYWLV